MKQETRFLWVTVSTKDIEFENTLANFTGELIEKSDLNRRQLSEYFFADITQLLLFSRISKS